MKFNTLVVLGVIAAVANFNVASAAPQGVQALTLAQELGAVPEAVAGTSAYSSALVSIVGNLPAVAGAVGSAAYSQSLAKRNAAVLKAVKGNPALQAKVQKLVKAVKSVDAYSLKDAGKLEAAVSAIASEHVEGYSRTASIAAAGIAASTVAGQDRETQIRNAITAAVGDAGLGTYNTDAAVNAIVSAEKRLGIQIVDLKIFEQCLRGEGFSPEAAQNAKTLIFALADVIENPGNTAFQNVLEGLLKNQHVAKIFDRSSLASLLLLPNKVAAANEGREAEACLTVDLPGGDQAAAEVAQDALVGAGT